LVHGEVNEAVRNLPPLHLDTVTLASLHEASDFDLSPSANNISTQQQHTMDTRRPRSSQKVSMTWQEDEATVTHRRRMQFADECVETKTVTTTTTTKRSYPPLFLREPRDVHSLDSKEYPLAARPTPPELRKLTFDLDDYETEAWEDEDIDVQVSDARL
jgi:hypothetical protein